jgi:hypothetical protein
MSWFSDFVDSVKEAFSGSSSNNNSQSDSGSDRAPTRSQRPPPRPSIMTVQRQPEDDRQLVATRDMPRFGISEGQSESVPSYSPLSIQGLTSTDPGNVMRNIQGAERQARAAPVSGGGDEGGSNLPFASVIAPVASALVASSQNSPQVISEEQQEAQIERAGESAAAKARRLGLASTIATSPGGLLAGGEGTTRRRRSLMGGGLIA